MKIKKEILKRYIIDTVNEQIEDFEIDANKITDTIAIKILAEIQEILKNDKYTDFEIVEEIVCVFEKYKIDFGGCHDFS